MSARVLVVDDVDANVRLLEAKLTIEYFDVLTCQDGQSALAIAAESQPDLILLDVMMPGMDGFETCRRLKASSLCVNAAAFSAARRIWRAWSRMADRAGASSWIMLA